MTTREELHKLIDQLPDDCLEYARHDLLKRLAQGNPAKPLKSAYGALRDLGPAPLAEDIDAMRREAWRNFPQEDI